ncbi:MAG: hypothetical protein KGQ40_05745 [Rhodospirillales bacterium]|nr:hypothetical protein [Rhodospirillales bacterium]
MPPPPAPPSSTSQPNPSKNAVADTHSLDNTLEKLRALQKQTEPPKARANPLKGGAPTVGGSTHGDITATLSVAQRGAIGDKVRECWTKDAGALNADKLQVLLTVTLDRAGTARIVEVADADRARVESDPVLRAFFERARRAVLDPRCGDNLVPPDKLAQTGQPSRLTFRFSP